MGSSTRDSMWNVLQAGKCYAITIKPTETQRYYLPYDFSVLRNKIRKSGIQFEETAGSYCYESDSKGLVHFHGTVKVGLGRQSVRRLAFSCHRGWHIHISGEANEGWRTYINKHAKMPEELVWQRELIRFTNLRQRFTEVDMEDVAPLMAKTP